MKYYKLARGNSELNSIAGNHLSPVGAWIRLKTLQSRRSYTNFSLVSVFAPKVRGNTYRRHLGGLVPKSN